MLEDTSGLSTMHKSISKVNLKRHNDCLILNHIPMSQNNGKNILNLQAKNHVSRKFSREFLKFVYLGIFN
jgi:hypothetical protein